MISINKRHPKRSLRARLVALASAILMLGGLLAVGTAKPAEAVAGNVHVYVVTGGTLRVGCDWNSAYYYNLTNGQDSGDFCTADNYDTDWVKDHNSRRCIWVTGVGAAYKKRHGWYYITSGQKAKVTDLTNWYVYSYSKSKCGKRKYVNPS